MKKLVLILFICNLCLGMESKKPMLNRSGLRKVLTLPKPAQDRIAYYLCKEWFDEIIYFDMNKMPMELLASKIEEIVAMINHQTDWYDVKGGPDGGEIIGPICMPISLLLESCYAQVTVNQLLFDGGKLGPYFGVCDHNNFQQRKEKYYNETLFESQKKPSRLTKTLKVYDDVRKEPLARVCIKKGILLLELFKRADSSNDIGRLRIHFYDKFDQSNVHHLFESDTNLKDRLSKKIPLGGLLAARVKSALGRRKGLKATHLRKHYAQLPIDIKMLIADVD